LPFLVFPQDSFPRARRDFCAAPTFSSLCRRDRTIASPPRLFLESFSSFAIVVQGRLSGRLPSVTFKPWTPFWLRPPGPPCRAGKIEPSRVSLSSSDRFMNVRFSRFKIDPENLPAPNTMMTLRSACHGFSPLSNCG